MDQCGGRERQSPIDLDAKAPWKSLQTNETFFFNYQPLLDTTIPFRDNGHSLSLDLAGKGLGGLTWENDWYNIVSLNFHFRGEHLLRGDRPQAEVHLVHKKYDSDQIIVVALPVLEEKLGPIVMLKK